MYRKFVLVFTVVVSLFAWNQATIRSQEHGADLTPADRLMIDKLRGSVADFRDVAKAEKAGYKIFQNCFRDDKIGGMGQHYINGDLAGDDVADPLHPEAMVYEPREDGSLLLV